MFNNDQRIGFNILKSGVNSFITGGAGVGKTYLALEFVKYSEQQNKNIMVCASTGVAALNINGVTIHRQFDAPIGVINYSKNTYNANDELVYTDIVVLEEISMCRIDLFDFVANKIIDANVRRKRKGLPNIQLIVVGDFFQLPPVIQGTEKNALDKFYGRDIGAGYAFDSVFWEMFNFQLIQLNEVVRQHQSNFITWLNKIRVGEKAYINNIYSQSNPDIISNSITICGTNSESSSINEQKLKELNEEYIEYSAITSGDILSTDTTSELNLKLKLGARVIMLVNNEDYFNGALGTVEELLDNEIVVQLDNGHITYVKRYTWEIYRYDLVDEQLVKQQVGTLTQFPLKLAYAITIHKSQGQTYESANISPYSWDCGQLYVALSRIKSLENIHFNYQPDIRYIVVSLTVIKFYNSLIHKQSKAESKPEEISENKEKEKENNELAFLLQSFNNL